MARPARIPLVRDSPAGGPARLLLSGCHPGCPMFTLPWAGRSIAPLAGRLWNVFHLFLAPTLPSSSGSCRKSSTTPSTRSSFDAPVSPSPPIHLAPFAGPGYNSFRQRIVRAGRLAFQTEGPTAEANPNASARHLLAEGHWGPSLDAVTGFDKPLLGDRALGPLRSPTGRSSAWLERTVRVREVESSNLSAPTENGTEF